MILAHRKELVLQASLSLASLGVEHSVIAPGNVVAEIKIQHVRELGACYVKPSAHVSVGSVQTIVRRLPSIAAPTLIVVDECFPAGTLVDDVEIQKIKIGDQIRSVNHCTGKIEMKPVTRIFRNKCADLCKVTISNGKAITCTPGHPFYSVTNKKYVSAFLLKEGDYVTSVPMQALRESCSSNNEMAKGSNQDGCGDILQHHLLESVLRSNLVQDDVDNQLQICVWTDESEEPDATGIDPREDEGNTTQDRTQAETARREWSRANSSANPVDGAIEYGRIESCAGVCTKNRIPERKWISTGLQDRHCDPIDDDRDRSGRGVPQCAGPQGTRLEENGNPFCVRVDRIEIYERESAQRYGNGFVYNLEVEGNHNYFVDDVLVHNCHHATAGQWRDIINYFPRARILGVTATPIRTDGQGLGTHVGGVFDSMVLGPTMRELIAMGNLVMPKIYMPGTEIDLKGVRVTASGDYNSEQLNERLKTARPTIIGDAVEWYRKLAHGKRAVAFCASVGAAQATAKAFCDAGYKFVSLDGTMDNSERRRAVLMLNSGEIDGITSCDIVSEGFDCPGLEVAILLRPTHSEGLYLQQVGRVLRPAPGKDFGIIIDHVGNVANFGPPHWDREWSLDGGLEKRKSSASQEEQVLIRTCPKCFSVHDPAPKCPECGHIYVIKARKLDQKDGELIELTPEMEAKMAMQKGKAKQQGRAQTIENLIRLAMTRGNDPAWAYHIFMSRDGNTAHDVKSGVERLLGEMQGEIEANPLGSSELRANMAKIHQAYSYRLGKVGVALAPMQQKITV